MRITNKVTTTERGIQWLAGLLDDGRVLIYRDGKIHSRGVWRGGLIHRAEVGVAILGRLERKLAKAVV